MDAQRGYVKAKRLLHKHFGNQCATQLDVFLYKLYKSDVSHSPYSCDPESHSQKNNNQATAVRSRTPVEKQMFVQKDIQPCCTGPTSVFV